MFSFIFIYLFLSLIAGFSSLFDRRWLGLVVNRTGPNIGYGFLTIIGDGYKLFSKNPWNSFVIVVFAFFLYNFETISIGVIPINQDVGLILLGFLGSTGTVLSIIPIYFSRGYSTLGKYRSQIQILLGEGIFSLFLFIILLYSCFDFLFYIEQDYFCIFSFYTLYIFLMSFFLILLGERHPWDIPESESDLGGGLGVNLPAFFFMVFAILEYRWILYFSIFCYIAKLTLWPYLSILFLLRGILPRFSYKLFIEQIWFYIPIIIKTWLFFSIVLIILEFCFLLFQ